jgi:hypothetical protein
VTESDGQRAIDWNFSDGQWAAMESPKCIILALAGWQSGKTGIGPPWRTGRVSETDDRMALRP